MSDIVPLPATMTEKRLRSASPEQRAAWLAEADATAPARAARMRETLSKIAAPAAPATPLPVGADREEQTRRYEAWQDAQVAAGRETCDHGESLARTCLPCFDGRVWERAAPAVEAASLGLTVDAVLDADDAPDGEPWPLDEDDDEINEDTECGDCGSGKTGGLCLECDPHEMVDDAPPAGEIDLRVEALTADFATLASRVTAIEQRQPVVAPPAIPAELAARLEVAEGVATTARKAVEALAARVAVMAQPAQTVTAAPTATIETRPAPPMRSLRCSSLPLFRACAASMDRTPEMILVESEGEPARLGTAVHEVAAHMICLGREAAQGIVADVAARHDVDAEDLGYLAYQAAEAWVAIGDRFASAPAIEEAMDASLGGAMLTGHPDLYAIDRPTGRTLRVLDWKSGRARYDAREQLLGYAWLCLSHCDKGTIDQVELYAVWLRPEHGGIQRLVYSADEVRAWRDETARRATATPLPYSPGPHCVQCHRCADCPAKAAWVRQAVAEFAPGGTTAEALAAARAVAKAAAQAIEAIRTQATTAGVEGVRVTEERRVSVRLNHPAVPVSVREALAGEVTAAGGKVRSALLKVLGLKGPEADEEMARLEAAGAAKVTVSKKVAGEE